MSKYSFILILIDWFFPLKILAQGVNLQAPISPTSIPEVIERLTNFIFTLAFYLLPLIIVTAGIFFVTASGKVENVEKGKKLIIYGLIGFVIVLAARGLIALFRQAFRI